MEEKRTTEAMENMSLDDFKKEVVHDYRLAVLSREASLIGRKEVLTGKAKFGIFGDGKEVPQIAMAKAFQNGDIRSGYYRDQTFVFATGMGNVRQFFAQLYADANMDNEPFSGGRQMNSHFATHFLDENGDWKNLVDEKHSSADSSPTASQMARAVGLALASKIYRNKEGIRDAEKFSNNGNEVVFATIGDASTSEGIFWESVNAAGVLKIPMAISVWDDGYGISVPKEYQTTKGDISEALKGLEVNEKGEGYHIFEGYAWDYPGLVEMYQKGIQKVRETHLPALFHIREVTQPQGHSTSGSHERYKSKERLQWEIDMDCNLKMRNWILENGLANEEELSQIEQEAKKDANEQKKEAWKSYIDPIKNELKEVAAILEKVAAESSKGKEVSQVVNALKATMDPIRKDMVKAAKECLRLIRNENFNSKNELLQWLQRSSGENANRYSSHLYSQSGHSVLKVGHNPAQYSDDSPMLNGYEILNKFFNHIFETDSRIVAFGEDLGKIGDVNQGFAGLQDKYGEVRIFDTGIREATIIGQGLGMAMRGLRPIAEIQYLDYLIYGLQPIVDDIATLQYRTRGKQKAPVIIRTRGHRLEGIWHTGSPMGMIIHSVRGVHVLVPRNMVQAVGMYKTMLQSDEPAIIIEPLNGYRLKEKQPDNLTEFNVPLGVPEIIQPGEDITIVSYGSTLRIAFDAVKQLSEVGISAELIDVQTLLPFDIHHKIVESLQKTNRIMFVDEDVPGGASAFMMQKVVEEQNGYRWLDSPPVTVAAKEHRTAYASDGDYFGKPNAEDIYEAAYKIMHEYDPARFPDYF